VQVLREEAGLSPPQLAKVLCAHPRVLSLSLDRNLRPKMAWLKAAGVPRTALGKLLAACPALPTYSLAKLQRTHEYLQAPPRLELGAILSPPRPVSNLEPFSLRPAPQATACRARRAGAGGSRGASAQTRVGVPEDQLGKARPLRSEATPPAPRLGARGACGDTGFGRSGRGSDPARAQVLRLCPELYGLRLERVDVAPRHARALPIEGRGRTG
jgi:hypothetical protein